MIIPFTNLIQQYEGCRREINQNIHKVISTGDLINSEVITAFEREFADFVGTKYAIGVGSGTDALRLSLMALGIGPGDEVITVANTFIGTTEAISQVGAKIVFVDIDPNTYNIDPAKITGKITGRTKAIIPVHMFGQPADMDRINAIAKKHKLTVIEDACQAHGAEYRGRKAGALATAGCFSFYPTKNLGACGEAGMITTNHAALVEKIKLLLNHGQVKKYLHKIEGYNSRLDAIQAAILRVKLRKLPRWNELRRKNAQRYNNYLRSCGVVVPFELSRCHSVYYVYVIRSEHRDQMQQALASNGVATGIHYPIPLHLQEAYRHYRYRPGALPVTEAAAKEILSLPLYPELTEKQIKYVSGIIENVTVNNRPRI